MKNTTRLFILVAFLLCSGLLEAQTATLLGSWKVTREFEKTSLPKTMTFDLFKDSIILIKPVNDSLNFTTILRSDSSQALIKNALLDAKNNKYISYYGTIKLSGGGTKLLVEYTQEKTAIKKTIEYALVQFCCSNHTPPDCTTKSSDISKMQATGCSGIHSR